MKSINSNGLRFGSGIYSCFYLHSKEGARKYDHLSDDGQTTLCERKMGEDVLSPSEKTWNNSTQRCTNCQRKGEKIRKLQKMFTQHTREGTCRGELKEVCPACSIGDELRDLEIPTLERE